jgi:Flp pilus assembly protein TadG
MNALHSKHRQQGLTTVEFSLVGMVLFMVLFGLIEFGRLMFTWNVLDEATRRAARLAAVCPATTDGQNFVRNAGAFSGDILPGFTADNIALSYWQEDGLTAATATENTYYVRASITNYTHQLLIPFVDIDPMAALTFETTLPAESLGVHPADAGSAACP